MSAPESVAGSHVAKNRGISGLRSELPAGLAHQLNQPLAAIQHNAQAARRFIVDGEMDHEELLAILDDIIRDTKRASDLISPTLLEKPD